MAGAPGQHRVQTHQRDEKEKEEKKVLIKYAFALLLGTLAAGVTMWRYQHPYTSSPVFVVEVTGNVIQRNICTFRRKPGIKDLFECGGGAVEKVDVDNFDICNGCRIYLPYRGEHVKVEKMHVMLLNALGLKKCLKEASLSELESLPGIGRKKARLIASFILSGSYMRGEKWPREIGKKTREIIWTYFDDCRNSR